MVRPYLCRHWCKTRAKYFDREAYWQIGRIIVEHEQDGTARAGYGKSVLQELSNRLTEDFGKGFSVRTLQQMKKFYVMFPNTNALRSQLTWTHYRLLLSVENEQARQRPLFRIPKILRGLETRANPKQESHQAMRLTQV